MLIATDLDNTLYNDPVIEKASKEMGLHYDSSFHTTWDLDILPPPLRARIRELWGDPEHMGNLTPIEGTREALTRMKQAGNSIVVVTARYSHLEESTKAMIHRDFPGLVDAVYVVGLNTDKTALLQTLDADLWVDDAPHQTIKTRNAGIPTILISNENTKYNWLVRVEKGLTVRKNLADIEESLWTTPC
jgi:5'(3')-deoxyribonucleotidase